MARLTPEQEIARWQDRVESDRASECWTAIGMRASMPVHRDALPPVCITRVMLVMI